MMLDSLQIAEASGGQHVADGPAGSLVTDTRKLRPGDWFLALKGPNFDGNTMAGKARDAGCAGAVLERAPEDWDCGLVLVEDGLLALQDCARWVREQFQGPVIGITGSSGKTTTRAMVADVLSQGFRVHQTAGNLNNHIGVPLTILSMGDVDEVLVLEMGMNAPGEIELLQSIGRPTVRLITNVSLAHAEGTGDLRSTAACKEELFVNACAGDTLIVNVDDPMVVDMPRPSGCKVVTFGTRSDCDFVLQEVVIDSAALTTRMVAKTPLGCLDVEIPAPGHHIAIDALSAAAIGVCLGLGLPKIKDGLMAFEPVGMRMRIQELSGGITLLNDAYNANPASTLASLETLASIQGRRRIALLGDMLELGKFEAESHREIVRAALDSGIEVLGLVGPRFRQAAEAVPDATEIHLADTAEAMGLLLTDRLGEGDVLLLKGSRGLAMERVLHGLGLQEA